MVVEILFDSSDEDKSEDEPDLEPGGMEAKVDSITMQKERELKKMVIEVVKRGEIMILLAKEVGQRSDRKIYRGRERRKETGVKGIGSKRGNATS